MSKWIDAGKAAQFTTGQKQVIQVEGVSILLFNRDGEFFAIENTCTHDYGPLDCGFWQGDEIVCPRHGARFSIKTGEVLAPPAYEALETFSVRVQDGVIQIEVE